MKFNRPPFVLAFPGDLAGCGYHRVIRPLQILGRNGVIAGRAEVNFPDEKSVRAISPDVVLFQRHADEHQIATIDKYRAALPDAFFVYEIDDALSAVPDASWHKPYMTPNIDIKTAKAITRFDVITVTTNELADHMRKITGNSIPVRVVPNMLGADDLELAAQTRKQSVRPPTDKLRVGWGGGIGHAGDLALLKDVFTELKDEVEWCFIGMDPTLPPGAIKQYYGATTPDRYLASLAAINVDVVIAPLEDNLFNRCKSNLRLVEAGACLYPVIASSVAPYMTDNPPVYDYATTPSQWIDSLRNFASISTETRERHAKAMNDWVKSRYNMDEHAEKRLLQWLPDRSRAFKPRLNTKGTGTITVTNTNELRAAFETTSDILYIRPGVSPDPDALKRLLDCTLDAVCGLANDGGPWGFPSQQQFTQLDPAAIAGINSVITEFAKANPISLSAVSGPVVLLRRSALAAVGMPDINSLHSIEIAILEWSCAVRSRGLKIGLCPSVFTGLTAPTNLSQDDMQNAAIRINGRWPQGQNDDASLKALRESLELAFHRQHYHALPPPNRGDFTLWAHLADTRGPKAIDAAIEWQLSKERPTIDTINLPNHFDAKDHLDADWLFFIPASAQLAPDAMQMILWEIEKHPEAKVIYGDHDIIGPNNQRVAPDFKPNFDLHLFLSRDYMGQCVAIKRENFVEFPSDIDEATVYASILEIVALESRASIIHCPHILTHVIPVNITDALMLAPKKLAAAKSFVKALQWNIDIEVHEGIPLLRTLKYDYGMYAPEFQPKVSIIVPCKDNLEMLAPCIATILTNTIYQNYEILIIDNGSTRQEMLDYQASLDDPRVRLYKWPHPYNWSALNNWAVGKSDADFFCFLNDDTRVMSRNWLSEMVGAALIRSVGAVGARLLYPHGQIQHVGVVVERGLTGHLHKGLPANNPGVNAYAIVSHESTAVTGACLLVSRKNYDLVNGFNETLPHNFNDVVFCTDLLQHGLVNVVCARAELQHFEGVTRNAKGLTPEAEKLLQEEGKILAELNPRSDPYWNPNLLIAAIQNGKMIAGMGFDAYTFPGLKLPWTESEFSRILVIGPVEPAAEELHDSVALYKLDITGNSARISNPPMVNCGPWDIRRPDVAAAFFEKLDLSKIILTQLGEAPVQTLQFLRKLGLPIEYRPVDAEAACPRGNLKPTDKSCNGGYKRGECQSCMDINSSPHGNVLMASWLSEWIRFLSKPVKADLSYISDPAYRDSLEHAFGGGARSSSEDVQGSTEQEI